jgi:hypothetical protein
MNTQNPAFERVKKATQAANRMLLPLLTTCLAIATPLFSQTVAATNAHQEAAPPELVRVVRDATRQFINVNAAENAGYHPGFGCVSGPDHGAMGVHYINGGLLNGEVNATTPQALIYEPLDGGRKRLVGVEFIVDAKTWWDKQKEQGVQNPAPPQLYEQLFQLIPSPNRYGLDTFFELHVWAWKDNPNGAFVDWNNNVNCNHQESTL